MTVQSILEKCNTLDIREERTVSDDYLEIVFPTDETGKWKKLFTDILDSAIKPEGVKPSSDHLEVTKPFGGIYPDQTLFRKDFDDATIIAMFWPWQDDENTTLKVAIFKK